ncbi:hypothetical protein AVO42_05610 [Thiomicrospira sp. XS5]|uniref:flagellar hook-length control protein FliK n=1 Tax=Thiomicrospira sp. XS5 TaxID=1775636 RepID=UPI0007488E72|nr:flagellar hook-length control protein FliK [Thiomicrospira sp. XS5]KUJ74855.1 hypothetical protein AVO42_05610 [Thiomicrospira sp. XS5]
MAIGPTSTPLGGNLNLGQTTPQALKLAVGQLLSVTVTKTEGSQVTFSLAGRSLTATSQQSLEAGQQLNVKVTQTKPNIVLQIQGRAATNTAQPNTQQTLQTAYRQLLPNQVPINQGLQQLVQLSQTGILPANIQSHLSSLLEQLFKPSTQTSAKELKNQLLSSGLFLENQLAKNNKPQTGDLKGRLLQLLQMTQQAKPSESPELPKLAKLLSQTLNRITLQQIQAIENPNQLNIQLPLQPNPYLEEVEIDIRRQAKDTLDFWEVIVNLTLSSGELSSKLMLMNDEISLSLWADNSALAQRLGEDLPKLQESFQQAALPLKQIFITQQKPESHPLAQKVALIDLHV